MDKINQNNIRIGVAAIIMNQRGEVFIAKSLKVSGWTVPGGHVNFGETIKKDVIREVFEETGMDITVVKKINFYEIIELANFHMISFHFLCSVIYDKKIKLDNNELFEGKWVSPLEAFNLIVLDEFKKSIELFINLK